MIAAMARRISSPIIVGRTEELEALLAAAERGAAVDTETVVVRGEAGIGKSRLVLELGVEASSRGFELVVGGCPALVDSPLPFAPIVAATEAILRTRDGSAAHALLDGIGPDLVRIAPALGARFGVADPPPVPEGLIPGRVFDAVRTLLQRAAAVRPLVVVFEDLHWADPASLDLIGYLVRSRGWPGAIVLTYRSDELHRRHPLLPWIAELSRVPTVEVLELGRLGRDEVAVQAEAILGRLPEQTLVDELVQRAGGNAFITEELLASLDQAGRMPREHGRHAGAPRPCRDAARRRRIVVEAMSVAGVGVDEATVASVIAVPELDVESALRTALDAQLIVGVGRRLRVPSRLVAGGGLRRPAAERAPPLPPGLCPVPPGGRRATGQAPSAARLAEVAHHALAADDLPTGAAGIGRRRAGGHASAGAFVDASRHLERAVQLVDAVPDAGEPRGRRAGRGAPARGRGGGLLDGPCPCRAAVGGGHRGRRSRGSARGAGRAPAGPGRVRQRRVPDNELALASTREANALLADEPPSSLRARALSDLSRDLSVVERRGRGDPRLSEAAIAMAVDGGRSPDRGARARQDRAQPGPAGPRRTSRTPRRRCGSPGPRGIASSSSSVYFNIGYLFDTARRSRDGRREILANEGLPLLAELGLPTVALSAHAGWYLWQAGRWDDGPPGAWPRPPATARCVSGRNLALAMTHSSMYEAVTVADAGIGA